MMTQPLRDSMDSIHDNSLDAAMIGLRDQPAATSIPPHRSHSHLSSPSPTVSSSQIPVSGISIGPVHRKDVTRASVMLERRPEYAVILAFDVKVAPEAEKLAAELGVTIFTADIIYHLYDKVTAYMARIKEERRAATADVAVFPVVLDILAVFNNKNPLLLGCRVIEGQAKIGTPLCVPAKERLFVGRITGLQKNHEDIKEAKKNDEVAVKIEMDKSAHHTQHRPQRSPTRTHTHAQQPLSSRELEQPAVFLIVSPSPLCCVSG